MSVFDRFFKSEEKPVAAIGGEPPDAPVEVVGAHATTKLKLNFKRLPKKMVQAIADQTTGQTIVREGDEPLPARRRRLSEAFAAAARDTTRDDRDRRGWGSEAKAMTAAAMPLERIKMPRPRPPSPSF